MKITATLEEFLKGASLNYRGADFKKTTATFMVGDGIYLERKGVDLGKAEVQTIAEARRVYHQLTRS